MLLKRLTLLTLILGFIIAIGFAVKAHNFIGINAKTPHLNFIGKVEITCNIDGKWFNHYRVKKDGKVIEDFWHEEPRDPIVSIKAEAHGFGWAYTTFHGNIAGKPFDLDGDTTDDVHNSTSEQIGMWNSLLPFVYHGDHRIYYEEKGKFNHREGVYDWDGNGTIELVPWVWQWRLSLPGAGGEWKPADKREVKKKNAEAAGSWTVKHRYSSLGSDSNDGDDDEEEDDSEEQGNANPPTVPDRPGSFDLTPHRYAIRLTWTDSASNGGSDITDYQYQYQSSNYNRTRWSDWSDWTSAGTGNSTWITGLSSGVNYGVRMRAVNDIGNSSKTGIKIVKTTE